MQSNFATNFKTYRAESGFSLQDIAKLLDTTKQNVWSWETGRTEPTFTQLAAVAQVLGCSADDLLREVPTMTSDLVLRVHWDDQAGVELAGWYVQALCPNEYGDLETVSDSLKVDFKVEVTDYRRDQRADLLAALAVAYPGAEISSP